MPTKKKRFNARFPPARIKKIMQTDEEVGKVAAAVPVIISKALEMFMQSLVENACDYAQSRNAKTMTTGHLKKCILAQQQFDFLKDLVEHVPDLPTNEDDTEGEVKPKRRRTQPQDHEKKKRERKKPKPSVSDESEEELQSDEEEEDSGSSEGLGTNPSSSTTNLPKSSVARSTSQLSEQPDSRLDNVAASYAPQFSQFSSMLSAAQDEEDDDYDA